MSLEKVKSRDGTMIAFEITGQGPPLVLVGGAFNDRKGRASGTPLAALLTQAFTVLSYDRRGRGDSGDTPPYDTAREVEDLAALIERAGGSAHVYGMSSGALLALCAAQAGLSIPKLALYEPPIFLDAARAKGMVALAVELEAVSREGRRADAVEIFMTRVMQMPPPAFEQVRKSPFFPSLEALAHTLAYDVRLGALAAPLVERAGSVRAVTLALHGDAAPPWMREGIQTLAGAIPGARCRVLEGQTHDVDTKVLAGALEAFFTA
jgi:pimeloyl-ACP methyl ester carboxylesterase